MCSNSSLMRPTTAMCNSIGLNIGYTQPVIPHVQPSSSQYPESFPKYCFKMIIFEHLIKFHILYFGIILLSM
jgi:hypothetical protein